MTAGQAASREHYELADGRYVLYVGAVRLLATPVVALLVETRSARLLTHGDPPSVRAEWQALQADGGSDGGWLLLEGRPPVGLLNRALREAGALLALRAHLTVCADWQAERLTRALMTRLRESSKGRGA
jgi:hypothetical protein